RSDVVPDDDHPAVGRDNRAIGRSIHYRRHHRLRRCAACERACDHKKSESSSHRLNYHRALRRIRITLWPASSSKTYSHSQLECARATRTEQLREARRRLAERGARKIGAIAGEIRSIVEVEHFADQ